MSKEYPILTSLVRLIQVGYEQGTTVTGSLIQLAHLLLSFDFIGLKLLCVYYID